MSFHIVYVPVCTSISTRNVTQGSKGVRNSGLPRATLDVGLDSENRDFYVDCVLAAGNNWEQDSPCIERLCQEPERPGESAKQ